MEEGLFLRRIQEEFPDVAWTAHRYLTHGWDHAVLVLDEALVFRAPKVQAYRDALANEARLLRHLQPRVEVGVPDYVYESTDGSFAGYPLLTGRELDVDSFDRISAAGRERIADQLAAFLTAVHQTPASIAHACGVSEQQPSKDYEDLVRDTEALVLPRLAPQEVRVVRIFLTELAAAVHSTYPTSLVHGDLGGEHILWDSAKQHVNVIDFSDRSIGDPALDFAGLRAYGHDFAGRVLERYRGPRDEGNAAEGGVVLPPDGTRDDGRPRSKAIPARSKEATRSSRSGSRPGRWSLPPRRLVRFSTCDRGAISTPPPGRPCVRRCPPWSMPVSGWIRMAW